MKLIMSALILNTCFWLPSLAAEQQEITIDGAKVKCLVSSPPVKDKQKPGLFIFMGPGSGGVQESQMAFDAAKEFCAKYDLLLLTPISDDSQGFIDDKNAVVIRLAKSLIADGRVSPKNMLIGGMSRGGVAALQIAGAGDLPLDGVVAVPGIFYSPPKKTAGFKKLHVYLRIGVKDEKQWSGLLDQTRQSLQKWGAIVDSKLAEKGTHLFDVDWAEVAKWREAGKKAKKCASSD